MRIVDQAFPITLAIAAGITSWPACSADDGGATLVGVDRVRSAWISCIAGAVARASQVQGIRPPEVALIVGVVCAKERAAFKSAIEQVDQDAQRTIQAIDDRIIYYIVQQTR